MSDQKNTNPSNNFNFDFSDFGEPTQETLLALANAIEALKHFTASKDRGLTVLRLDDDPNPQVPKIDGVLNHYFVTSNNDSGSMEPRFTASIYDAKPEIMAQVQEELDYIVSIHYSDQDREISYKQVYGQDPTLYIRVKHDRVERETTTTSPIESSLGSIGMSIKGTPDFMRFIHARFEERREAHQQGRDKPTEGSMKMLIGIINAEIGRKTIE